MGERESEKLRWCDGCGRDISFPSGRFWLSKRSGNVEGGKIFEPADLCFDCAKELKKVFKNLARVKRKGWWCALKDRFNTGNMRGGVNGLSRGQAVKGEEADTFKAEVSV